MPGHQAAWEASSRPFDPGHFLAAQKAWARDQGNENLILSRYAWHTWIGRPDGYLLSTSGHIIEAQKAWAAEQTKKRLPVTLAAWGAWLAGPAKITTDQPRRPAGLHQLRQEHLRDQRATQTAWVAEQAQKTGIDTIGPLLSSSPNTHSDMIRAARRMPTTKAGLQAGVEEESGRKADMRTTEPLSQQFVLITTQHDDIYNVGSLSATATASMETMA